MQTRISSETHIQNICLLLAFKFYHLENMKKSILFSILCLLISGMVYPQYAESSSVERAKFHAAKFHIELFEKAIQEIKNDIKRFPTQEEGLNLLLKNPASEPSWKGPYLNKPLPNDPWGNEYKYFYPSRHGTKAFDLYSFGVNEKDDSGDVDDISNWKEADGKYYGMLSKAEQAALKYLVGGVLIFISLISFYWNKPTSTIIAFRFGVLTVSTSLYVLLRQFHSPTNLLIFVCDISSLIGCILFSVIGLFCTSISARKFGYNKKHIFYYVSNSIPWIIILIVCVISFVAG